MNLTPLLRVFLAKPAAFWPIKKNRWLGLNQNPNGWKDAKWNLFVLAVWVVIAMVPIGWLFFLLSSLLMYVAFEGGPIGPLVKVFVATGLLPAVAFVAFVTIIYETINPS
jgi:hypothetical protein